VTEKVLSQRKEMGGGGEHQEKGETSKKGGALRFPKAVGGMVGTKELVLGYIAFGLY